MDDALSVRELPSGDLEIGVHIADVSHFVQQVQITPAPQRNETTLHACKGLL